MEEAQFIMMKDVEDRWLKEFFSRESSIRSDRDAFVCFVNFYVSSKGFDCVSTGVKVKPFRNYDV